MDGVNGYQGSADFKMSHYRGVGVNPKQNILFPPLQRRGPIAPCPLAYGFPQETGGLYGRRIAERAKILFTLALKKCLKKGGVILGELLVNPGDDEI